MTVNLLDFDAAGLTDFFAEQGEKSFRARQVLRWIHRCGQGDFAAMTDIAKTLRAKLMAVAVVAPPAIVSDRLADDGTRKFLFDVGGGNAVQQADRVSAQWQRGREHGGVSGSRGGARVQWRGRCAAAGGGEAQGGVSP